MYLHNSFCYEDLQTVADTIYSKAFLANGDAITSVAISGQSLQITVSNTQGSYLVTHTPPACEQLGFNNSYTGLDVATAVELGTLFMLAVISVWSIKIAKRGA